MKTRILTRADVESLLTMDIAVPAVEAAFAAHGRGEAINAGQGVSAAGATTATRSSRTEKNPIRRVLGLRRGTALG